MLLNSTDVGAPIQHYSVHTHENLRRNRVGDLNLDPLDGQKPLHLAASYFVCIHVHD